MPDLPSGNVTFLFTDIEGSTRLWERDSNVMTRALARHNEILDRAIAEHQGVHFKTIGDAFQAAFSHASAGVSAAVTAQRALSAEPWSETGPIRVRMALHSGAATPDVAGDYLAPCLNRLSRMLSTGFGGQVLLSQAAQQLVGDATWQVVTVRALGRHRLRDLLEPEQIAQLVIEELPDTFPPLKSLEGYSTNLPVLPTALFGRERELMEMSGLLNGGHRLLTLVGPGGVGKTHLALQAAADNLEQFEDGVWLVPLGELTDPTLLLLRIATTLGIREGGGLDTLEALFTHLSSKRTLLLLEIVEQLLSAAPDVADLLARCPDVRILVTSRQRLNIGGETLLLVDPLAPPDRHLPPQGIRDNAAVQLFLERATALDPRFRLNDEVAKIVASICVHLDGLPLAIELAAAQLSHYTPRELLGELNNRFQLLTGGRREVLSHQQTLAETISWSYDRLPPDEQRLFRALSVFAGGWRRAAAAAVVGSGDDQRAGAAAVVWLVEASLVRRLPVDSNESRWTMLESIREFGRERLDVMGGGSGVRERHAKWCLSFVNSAANEPKGRDQTNRFHQLELEHDNARASLRWCSEAARVDLQPSLASALASFWQVRGYLSEGRLWLEQALERAAPNHPDRLPGMVDAGILAQAQGDNDKAAKWFEQALEKARAVHDQGREAALLNNLGIVAHWRGNIEEAEGLFTEALSAAEAIRDRRRHADALGNLGAVAHYRGDTSIALERYIECANVWRELQDANGTADTLLNIVQLLAPSGDHRERARLAGEEALEIFRALRDPQGEALALSSLGMLAMIEGNLERATEHHVASLTLFREIADAAGEARALGSLGLLALDRGDLREAAEHLASALRLAIKLDEQDASAYWLEGLAALRLVEKDHQRSARLYGAVEALRDRMEIPRPPELQARFVMNMGVLRERLGASFEPDYAAGRALSLSQATSEALARASPLEDVGSTTSALRSLDELLGFVSTLDQ